MRRRLTGKHSSNGLPNPEETETSLALIFPNINRPVENISPGHFYNVRVGWAGVPCRPLGPIDEYPQRPFSYHTRDKINRR